MRFTEIEYSYLSKIHNRIFREIVSIFKTETISQLHYCLFVSFNLSVFIIFIYFSSRVSHISRVKSFQLLKLKPFHNSRETVGTTN
jgi:hypothetical protein